MKHVDRNYSISVLQVMRAARKKKWYNKINTIKDSEYSIVSKINAKIAQYIGKGESFNIPYKLGILEVRRRKVGAYYKEDKLKIDYPINWKATNKLWEEDAEAKKSKIYIRFEVPYVYYLHFNKFNIGCHNLRYYKIETSRSLKQLLNKNILNNNFNTLW